MPSRLDNQAINACVELIDAMPGIMRETIAASDTEERVKCARAVISRLARLMETYTYYAGQDEYGTPTMTVGCITDVPDEELEIALRAFKERMGEISDRQVRVGFLGSVRL